MGKEALTKGLVNKGADVIKLETTDKELSLINQFTLTPLEKEDVYTFKLVMCDNDIDRHFERFTDKALDTMAELFVGKPLIKDHNARADNQIGRIYSTEVVEGDGLTEIGTQYRQLIAHCYVLNIDSNRKLIADIKGGIKKEVSVGLRIAKFVCSICGLDNAVSACYHWWGKTDEGEVCHFTLEDPVDAYEVSFVVVPAQRNAGTTKSVEGDKDTLIEIKEKDFALGLKVKELETFIFIQSENTKEEE